MKNIVKTAFVFAGGGSLGAVQVGMLKALVRHDMEPDFVVGASVGAINAAYFSSDGGLAGIANLERIWLRLRNADIFPFSVLASLFCLLGRRSHLASSDKLRSLIESELPFRELQDARIPCHIVATDALEGTEAVFSSGDVVSALLASAAIPAVFPAVTIGERAFMDGGIASHTPISAAVSLGAERIIVLPTGIPCALHALPNSAIRIALHALNLLAMRQLLADVERFSLRCDLLVVPPLCPLTTNSYDFSQTEILIHRAEASTAIWLDGGMREQEPRWALLPHRHRAT